MKDSIQIYVSLLDEGTDVWRPVEAVHVRDDMYRIISSNLNPKDERWQFVSGDVVRCQSHVFADGSQGMVAYEIVGEV
jgi:hypothetical protein